MIYITRHGESEYNLMGRIGGDSSLTDNGTAYAARLRAYFRTEPLVICSDTKRTKETAGGFTSFTIDKNLNEIHAGICEHMTYDEIQRVYPDICEKRIADKLNFMYPSGESYSCVHKRVYHSINRLDTTRPTLIICHQAVARMILSILMKKKPVDCVTLDIPLHQLMMVDTVTAKLIFIEP